MKLFTAGLLTESSDLTPISTRQDDWHIERVGEDINKPTIFFQMLSLFSEKARSKGWDTAQSICATAFPPGGRSVKKVYENLRTVILDDLKDAMPVDGVLLQLHGAAMAHGYDDCEGDLLLHIRAITGPKIPIGVELDPHCHVTDLMMQHATAIVLYKTMMHTDIQDRAEELFDLMTDALEGKVKPTMALFDCCLMNSSGFNEKVEPMKSLFENVCEQEKQQGVLSISPVHGFPLANVPEMGSKMLVITDNNKELANTVATRLGEQFYQVGIQLLQGIGFDKLLDEATQLAELGKKAIPLIDFGDLVGCGYPTDSTELLQAMLARGMSDVAVGLMWDPLAVSICHDAGVDVQLILRIGGKVSPLSGAPLDLKVRIERLYKQIALSRWDGGSTVVDAAVVSSGDTEILLVSERVLGTGFDSLLELGLEPNKKKYLLLKHVGGISERHFILYGKNCDYRNWPFDKISRPKWPWDKAPFSSGSKKLPIESTGDSAQEVSSND